MTEKAIELALKSSTMKTIQAAISRPAVENYVSALRLTSSSCNQG